MKGNASLETELMFRSRLMKSSSRPGAIDHSLNHVCLDVIINNKTIHTIWEEKTLDSMYDARSKNVSILQRETNHIFIITMNKDMNFSKKKSPSLKDH